MTDPYLIEARAMFPYTQGLRRDFHRNPELGFHETRTAGTVARELNQLGLEVTTGIAETGVVAILEGVRSGPTLLVRFDMDALPIMEDTGKDYASINPGVMHACGHDGHVAVGLTLARLLWQHKEQLAGRVKFVFQPAEEGLGGAERMIDAGILDHPRPDITLSLHIWNERPVGTICIVPGPLMAGGEVFTVRVIGRGGHGALPHHSIDPVVATAQMITALQTITSRNVSPLQSSVVSVTQVRAGDAFNVIPQIAEFRGTIRTFEPDVRELVLKNFRQVATGVAEALGCRVEIELVRLTPPVTNDPVLAEKLAVVARECLPEAQIETNFRTMVSEDMAFMMEQIPGVYMLVGGSNPLKNLDYPHHHPKFDFDEEALIWASALMSTVVRDLLK